MRKVCQTIVGWPWFERFIIAVISINAVVLGLETYPWFVSRFHTAAVWIGHIVVVIFVIEAFIKITAVAPVFRKYFGDGWNLFDFTVVVLSVIPNTGEYAVIARTVRLLRVLRLITALPELRLIITTLIRSLPGIGNVVFLLGIVFYIYAIIGYHLFHEHDPTHWNSLGVSLITLFRVLTLEDWTDVMYEAMQVFPLAWLFFISFVVVAAFIVINMFIAVVINNLQKAQRGAEISSKDNLTGEILYEMQDIRQSLERVERAMESEKRD